MKNGTQIQTHVHVRRTSIRKTPILIIWLILLAVCLSRQTDIQAAGISIDGIPQPPSDQHSYLDFLSKTGQPTHSRFHQYPASFAAYRDYRLLVYGHPAQVPGNRYDAASRQYACLGFSFDELKVTNTLFPDDAPGGVSKSKPFSWVELNQGSKAADSWRRLNDAQKRYLKEAPLTYRNNSFGLMNFTNLKLNQANTVILAPPSWYMGSAIYTEHYLPGVSYKEVRYATFHCMGSGGATLSCSIDVMLEPDEDGYYTFPEGSDSLKIPYRVTGKILAMTGLAREQDIVIRGVGSADGTAEGKGKGPFIFNGILELDRSALAGQISGTATIEATAFVVSAMGDVILEKADHVIEIRDRKSIVPLAVEAELQGSIAFFSGSRTLTGRKPAASATRFLGLETIWLNVRFNKPVQSWQYVFLGKTEMFQGSDNQLTYRVPIQLPLDRSSLSWQDKRISSPHRIDITGFDCDDPALSVTAMIGQIEITGDILDLLYLQLAS